LTVGKDEKKQKSRSAAHIYLTRKDWKALILSGRSSSSALSLDKLISHYAKVGIAIDPQTRIVEEKMLYRVDMSQMRRQVGFIVYLDRAPDFSTVKYLRLGGANRPWVMKKRTQEWRLWNEQEIIKMAQQIRQTGFARIILLSPALWQNGSRPAAFDQQTRCLKLPSGLKVEAVAWAVGRPEVYGGWDIARHRPKARKNLAVAGTVIYVKVRPEQIDEFIRLADGFTLTDELAQQGYGFAVTCSCQNIDLED
jgi:CRISPR-associated protein Cmr3